jgi:hypothetical protein
MTQIVLDMENNPGFDMFKYIMYILAWNEPYLNHS